MTGFFGMVYGRLDKQRISIGQRLYEINGEAKNKVLKLDEKPIVLESQETKYYSESE